jgi:hypothetical protein
LGIGKITLRKTERAARKTLVKPRRGERCLERPDRNQEGRIALRKFVHAGGRLSTAVCGMLTLISMTRSVSEILTGTWTYAVKP